MSQAKALQEYVDEFFEDPQWQTDHIEKSEGPNGEWDWQWKRRPDRELVALLARVIADHLGD